MIKILFSMLQIFNAYSQYVGGDIMPMRPGGDMDTNGCIMSAGYSWCDSSQSCIRQWETPCEDNYIDCKDCLIRERNGENIACPLDCDLPNNVIGPMIPVPISIPPPPPVPIPPPPPVPIPPPMP